MDGYKMGVAGGNTSLYQQGLNTNFWTNNIHKNKTHQHNLLQKTPETSSMFLLGEHLTFLTYYHMQKKTFSFPFDL